MSDNRNMKIYTAKELYERLTQADECVWIEAKGEDDTSESLMESVCSFSNESGLGGGYILLGIGEDKKSKDDRFIIEGVKDPDKKQLDISTQCASMFNMAVRPRIDVEQLDGKNILKIFVPELPSQQKPLYFQKHGLPQGAWRRIGSSDQRCTEDDLRSFYLDDSSFDSGEVKRTSIKDVDEKALDYYRMLRSRVNPEAAELKYDNKELLESLDCLTENGTLTYTGLLMFGTKEAHRKFCPLARIDYIRVHGNEWVQNPDERFSTIEFTGSYLLQLNSILDAVRSELPLNFSLKEGQIQATTTPDLPDRVLREAIVNSIMHRSYRMNRPTQIIRYNNRIEIINAGFSLKDQEFIGNAGSYTRNYHLATIFHETNLAETKGTGIRTIRRLLSENKMPLPTFESNRRDDSFTIRLLVKPFYNEDDIKWLGLYERYDFNKNQKEALLFAREVGAVDTLTYSQMNLVSLTDAFEELVKMEQAGVLVQKGRTEEVAYYILATISPVNIPSSNEISPVNIPSSDTISPALRNRIEKLGKRPDKEDVRKLIIELCKEAPRTKKQLAEIFDRDEEYIKKFYLSKMVNIDLELTIPENPTDPNQAYKTK